MARTADGARTLAKIPGEDAAGIAFLTDGKIGPAGRAGSIARDASGDQIRAA